MEFRYHFEDVPISLHGEGGIPNDCFMTGDLSLKFVAKNMKPDIQKRYDIDVTIRDNWGRIMWAILSPRYPLYKQIYQIIEPDLTKALEAKFEGDV